MHTITMLNRRLTQRITTLVAAAILAAGLAVAMAQASRTPTQYGVASNGAINADGIQGSGAAPTHNGAAVSQDSNGVINTD